MNKPSYCQSCPINHVTGSEYVPLHVGSNNILFVGEAPGEDEIRSGKPFTGGSGSWLRSLCSVAKVDLANASLTNTLGCKLPNNIYPTDVKWNFTDKSSARQAVDYCSRHHLWPAINKANKPKIYALGGQALSALTNRNSISVWRGSPLALRGETKPRVIPTLHPAYLMRQAKLFSVVIGDLRKNLTLPPENYNLWPTLDEVEQFKSTVFAFDFEWDYQGNITLCGLTDRYYNAICVPFEGEYINILRRIFENATELIGHNIINADMAHIDKLGWDISKAKISDTMLKQHLIQPDYKHDLGFVASVFTNKVFWKGKGQESEDDDGEIIPSNIQWKTWDKPWAIPREFGGYGGCQNSEEAWRLYNARDTDGEYQINVPIDRKLKQYGMESTYENVSVPIAFLCRDMGNHGFKIDNTKLYKVRELLDRDITLLESQLPVGLAKYEETVSCNLPAPEGTYKPKSKKCKGSKKLGTSHETLEVVFNHPGTINCPSCGLEINSGNVTELKIVKGTRQEIIVPYNSPKQIQEYTSKLKLKTILDSKTGNATTGKKARSQWSTAGHSEFVTLGALKDKITLRNNFAKDKLLGESRMYFNLRVHGTSEGRLAASGQRKGIDLNIHNQPKEFRCIYIPDEPNWGILDLDIVQGENMLTTWLAKDWERWERINSPGYDEHADLASKIFNEVITKAKTSSTYWQKEHPDWTSDACEAKALHYDTLRSIGKKINHGRNYGMGARKQREELLTLGYDYTEKDVKEAIELWKKLNPGTAKWQNVTIETATKQGYLVNPFGRKRWFQSRDLGTKALAFLPASTLADMVLRMMIAHYPNIDRFSKAIWNLKLDTAIELVDGWRMVTQVHDSIVLMGPQATHLEQASRSAKIMSMPWVELDGFSFKVDTKYSTTSWGEGSKLKI